MSRKRTDIHDSARTIAGYYRAGQSIESLALAFECSTHLIRGVLKKAKQPMRPIGRQKQTAY